MRRAIGRKIIADSSRQGSRAAWRTQRTSTIRPRDGWPAGLIQYGPGRADTRRPHLPIAYAVWRDAVLQRLCAPKATSSSASIFSLHPHRPYWWTAFCVITLAITVVSVAIEFVLGMALSSVVLPVIFGRAWCAPRSGAVRHRDRRPRRGWYYAWTPARLSCNLLPTGTARSLGLIPSLAVVVLAGNVED